MKILAAGFIGVICLPLAGCLAFGLVMSKMAFEVFDLMDKNLEYFIHSTTEWIEK